MKSSAKFIFNFWTFFLSISFLLLLFLSISFMDSGFMVSAQSTCKYNQSQKKFLVFFFIIFFHHKINNKSKIWEPSLEKMPIVLLALLSAIWIFGAWALISKSIQMELKLFFPIGMHIKSGKSIFPLVCFHKYQNFSKKQIKREEEKFFFYEKWYKKHKDSISTIAGSGFQGDQNGNVLSASFNNPSSIAIDWLNSPDIIYVADSNSCIRIINQISSLVSTFAGNCSLYGYQNGPLLSTLFNSPSSIRYLSSSSGNKLLIADSGNNVIRMIVVSLGIFPPPENTISLFLIKEPIEK